MRLSPTIARTALLLLPPLASCDKTLVHQDVYSLGDSIQIECLNRTIDTGEHVTDARTGSLVYAPFAVCNETSAPLSIPFGQDSEVHCTIADLPDELYHLFEFYVHHDSPLACRIPRVPAGGDRELASTASQEAEEAYIPLHIVLAGKMEFSHLHVSTMLNMIVHIDGSGGGGTVDSAVAYSVSPLQSPARVMIGEPVPLVFRVRWYVGTELATGAVSRKNSAGHTMLYCLLSAGVGAVGCYAWVVGVDVPRRLRRVTVAMRGRADGGTGGIIGNIGAVNGTRGIGYGGYGGFVGNGNGTRSSTGTPVGKGYGGYGGYGGKRKD